MKALQRHPLEWMDGAPVRVEASRRIAASPAEVWAVIADHARWPEWFTRLDRVVPGPTDHGVGGTRRVEIGPLAFEEEFLVWEPDRRFAFAVTHLSRRVARAINEDVTLEQDGDGTIVSYVQALDVVAAPLLGPLLRRSMSRALASGLEGLENHLRSPA